MILCQVITLLLLLGFIGAFGVAVALFGRMNLPTARARHNSSTVPAPGSTTLSDASIWPRGCAAPNEP